MGGGVAGAGLAAAVSEAGGLGTIGILPAPYLKRSLAQARELTAPPIAVNLLPPFTRPEHWEVAGEADVVVTFWGAPVRRTSKPWIHQCGSVAEAHAAQVAGADAVIAQMGGAFPEIRQHRDEIRSVLTAEEERFAETLERVCVETVVSGQMTKDLALLVGRDTPFLTTEEFLTAIDTNLQKALA